MLSYCNSLSDEGNNEIRMCTAVLGPALSYQRGLTLTDMSALISCYTRLMMHCVTGSAGLPPHMARYTAWHTPAPRLRSHQEGIDLPAHAHYTSQALPDTRPQPQVPITKNSDHRSDRHRIHRFKDAFKANRKVTRDTSLNSTVERADPLHTVWKTTCWGHRFP